MAEIISVTPNKNVGISGGDKKDKFKSKSAYAMPKNKSVKAVGTTNNKEVRGNSGNKLAQKNPLATPYSTATKASRIISGIWMEGLRRGKQGETIRIKNVKNKTQNPWLIK